LEPLRREASTSIYLDAWCSYGEHAEEEGDHANRSAYVLKNYAATDELQCKATAAAKKSLQLKIIGTIGL
jgi:hypothetical protein